MRPGHNAEVTHEALTITAPRTNKETNARGHNASGEISHDALLSPPRHGGLGRRFLCRYPPPDCSETGETTDEDTNGWVEN